METIKNAVMAIISRIIKVFRSWIWRRKVKNALYYKHRYADINYLNRIIEEYENRNTRPPGRESEE
jgi:hypothetical protein